MFALEVSGFALGCAVRGKEFKSEVLVSQFATRADGMEDESGGF
jgi:hypothetical protein